MDWLDFGALTSGLVFGGFLSGVASPTKILAVSPEQYTSRNVLTREDAIVLYGPPASDRNKNQKSYEIVLHRPCTETLHQSYRFVYFACLFLLKLAFVNGFNN